MFHAFTISVAGLSIGLPWLCAAVLGGYLAGSLPFGLILTKFAGLGDVRQIGSGNIGATNVLRMGNKKIAAATLLADMLKGTIVAVIFTSLSPDPFLGSLAGFCAFLGHLFPLWLKFKGGKGVATYLGVLLALAPWAALIFAFVWLGVACISRYSSLAALIGAASVTMLFFPAVAVFATSSSGGYAITLMGMMIFVTHRANIKRLLKGTETRIKFKGK